MAGISADRVWETSTTTGTGNFTLAGAVSGYRAFSAVCANNDIVWYLIRHQSASEWEVGIALWTTGGVLVRAGGYGSAAFPVNFSAGTKDVSLHVPTQGLAGVTYSAPSTDQNDFDPGAAAIVRFAPTASIKVTGFAGEYDGRHITITNASTDYLMWLEHENTSSTATRRIVTPKRFPVFLMPGDSVSLQYAADRWYVTEWPNQGEAMGLTFFEDFAGAAHTSANNATMGRMSHTSATLNWSASTGLSDTTEKPVGTVQIALSTTGGQGATLGGSLSGGNITPTTGAALSVARVALSTVSVNASVFAGFMDGTGAGAVTDGVVWRYANTGSAAWNQSRFAGTTDTSSTTGSPTPAANQFVWLVVFVNPGWTRADFIYSTDSLTFTKADSPTTGFPGNTQDTSWGVRAVSQASTCTVYCDFAGYRFDSVRG